ncbi:MAG: hypothetical protein ABJB55_08400 [Actinomycetota bacterium]
MRELDRAPPPPVLREVDDGPAKVRIERHAATDMAEASYDPGEGLLQAVFGRLMIAGQEVRKSETSRPKTQVEIF